MIRTPFYTNNRDTSTKNPDTDRKKKPQKNVRIISFWLYFLPCSDLFAVDLIPRHIVEK